MDKNLRKKMVIEFMHTLWTDQNFDIINHVMDEKVKISSLLGNAVGPETMKIYVEAWFGAFPNMEVKLHDILCEDKKVVIVWDANGKHTGNYKGYEATGNSFFYTGTTVFDFDERDKVINYQAYLDMKSILSQIL